MQEDQRRVVAAFDFDGTLTRRDTLLPFLRFLCGGHAVTRTLARHSLTLGVAMAFDRHAQRAGVKERVLRDLLAGHSEEEVLTAGADFARRLNHPSRLRGDMVSRWRWHADQGHAIVVVSASLEAYIVPFTEALGGAGVLATRLSADQRGMLTGDFDGFNCRGAEKVRRLREWGVDPEAELWAYGNSSGDRELLAAARVSHRVGRGGRLRTPPETGGRPPHVRPPATPSS